ncbi:MAG: hypothetical protein AMJ70_07690 [Dehalococcoidia bacterium SG8_51_3]|jgi:hypothetical protein|nr:MAG: hypothetical protein AMJ70_07690 [Dehalococcoidia bacterium SG8_51_3]
MVACTKRGAVPVPPLPTITNSNWLVGSNKEIFRMKNFTDGGFRLSESGPEKNKVDQAAMI